MSPEVQTYTALLEAYGKTGDYRQAESVVRSMEANGFTPDVITLAVLVRTFGRADVFHLALKYFEKLATNENLNHEICRQVVAKHLDQYISIRGNFPPRMTKQQWDAAQKRT